MLARMRNYIKLVKYPSLYDHLIFWPIIIIGVIADLWSKSAVFKWLDWENTPYNSHTVIEGFFTIVMRENDGAAWGLASGQTPLLLGVSIVALIVVVGIFLLGNIRHRFMQVALALFTAGIIGNLYDRAFNEGHVRDFLDFNIFGYSWPSFNVADSLLCVSVGFLLIFNIIYSKEENESTGNQKSD